MTMRLGRGEHFRSASWLERQIEHWRGNSAREAPDWLRRTHQFVLDHLPGDHLVSTLPGGERVRSLARYRHLSWNPEEYQAFRAAVRSGSIVLDVGANIGAYTLLFAQWAGESGRVIAFEPAAASSAGLERQLRLNDLERRVEIVRAAASDTVGVARFVSDGVSGANALTTTDHGASIVSVPTTTLDAFCRERRLSPDVVKIDVEGAELAVLRGARETLAAGRAQAFVEFHPSVWAAHGVTPELIRAELDAQGLVAEPLDASIDIWNTEGISVRLRRRPI